MTGLEKILKAIEEEASKAAAEVIAKAQREADEITAEAKVEAEKKCAEIAKKSEADVKSLLSRAESAAALQEKKLFLDAKQQIISKVIEDAKNTLKTLSDQEYFDVIVKMVQKHALSAQGSIIFSMADKKRMPKDFEASIQKALSGKAGAALTISDEIRNLDGGFILIYGEVEENCSFDALFASAKEELQDKVNAFLFSASNA